LSFRPPLAVLAALLVALPAAGCGGSGGSSTTAASAPAISLGPLVRCLRTSVRHGRVYTAQAALDQIARRASAGAAAVKFGVSSFTPKGINIATIALERTVSGARTTEAHYRAVYKALGGNPSELLTRTANAVVAYGARPSKTQRAAITRCLHPAP